MDKFNVACEAYLKRINRLEPVHLGESKKLLIPEKKDVDYLTHLLNSDILFNNKIIKVAVLLLCILFAVSIALVIYHVDSPKNIAFFICLNELSK